MGIMANFTKPRLMAMILIINISCGMMFFLSLFILPLWRDSHTRTGVFLRDAFDGDKNTLYALMLWICIIGGLLLSITAPLLWMFGKPIAKMLYERVTGSDFGSEWLAEAFSDTVFRYVSNNVASVSWTAVALIWFMKDKNERLAMGWGALLFGGLIGGIATVANFLHPFAAEAPSDDAEEGGGRCSIETTTSESDTSSWWPMFGKKKTDRDDDDESKPILPKKGKGRPGGTSDGGDSGGSQDDAEGSGFGWGLWGGKKKARASDQDDKEMEGTRTDEVDDDGDDEKPSSRKKDRGERSDDEAESNVKTGWFGWG